MSDKPIIFDSASVQGILDDRITMTFRPVVPQPIEKYDPFHRWVWHIGHSTLSLSESPSDVCPVKRYCVGDILWVKEPWNVFGARYERDDCGYRTDYVEVEDPLPEIPNHPPKIDILGNWDDTFVLAFATDRIDDEKWRSPLYMPKWAARIWLEVVDVRVLRMVDVTDANCFAAGINPDEVDTGGIESWGEWITAWDYLTPFVGRWDASYARRGCGFANNPWVYAIAFRRVQR